MQTINSDLLNKDPILALKPLLNKINQTIFNYQDAIRLRSEKLIQEHLKKFSETLEIHELATKAISQIKDKAGDTISRELHYLTQEIGSAQAGLSQYSIKMQRSLAQINRQKVNLSNMGINTFQLKQWLKQKDEKTLANLLLGVLKKSAKPVFITNQFIDEANYELFLADRSLEEAEELIIEKDRSDVIDAQNEEMLVCNNLIDDIEKINESAEFIDIIATENWETASYRLSMLSLLHSDEIISSDDTNSEDSMIKFRKLPYKIEKIEKSQNLKTWWEQEDDIYTKKELKNTGLKELSKGLIHRK